MQPRKTADLDVARALVLAVPALECLACSETGPLSALASRALLCGVSLADFDQRNATIHAVTLISAASAPPPSARHAPALWHARAAAETQTP